MTTCPDVILKPLLLNASSHGAIDYFCTPKIFALQIAADYIASAEQGYLPIAPSLKLPLTLLAWMQMWLRLVLGLEVGSTRGQGTIAATPISYRQVEPETLDKPAAHNLEALMRFAPDVAGRGLTLNQYRERFTRLSVLGRIRIYGGLFMTLGRRRRRRRFVRGSAAKPNNRLRYCHAPLRPD